MFEGLIKQIGPGLPCVEFADDCIDYGFVLAAIVLIIGATIGLASYRRFSRKKTGFDTK
jgi:hypothetical protein